MIKTTRVLLTEATSNGLLKIIRIYLQRVGLVSLVWVEKKCLKSILTILIKTPYLEYGMLNFLSSMERKKLME